MAAPWTWGAVLTAWRATLARIRADICDIFELRRRDGNEIRRRQRSTSSPSLYR